MPLPSSAAVPSFIHLEQERSPRQSTVPNHPAQPHNGSPTTSLTSCSPLHINDAIGQAAVGLKRFTISRNRQHHPHSSQKRRGRPANSRVRGKHGIVKAIGYHNATNRGSAHAHAPAPARGANSHEYSTSNRSSYFNSETRSTLLKSYMQSRRLRLRRRLSRQQAGDSSGVLWDASDMSLDDDGDGSRDGDSTDQEAADMFVLDPEQYRRYMWDLEQRLWERTESAAKSRSHFLMERRVSAGERVDHVQRVVQRQRTEQEIRQHKVRDELEQKMMRAMARRKAYLEAAIENDPSRRFRRKGALSNGAVVSDRARDRDRGNGSNNNDNSSSSSIAVAGTGPGKGSAATATATIKRSCAIKKTTTALMTTGTTCSPGTTEERHDKQQRDKNSRNVNMMTNRTKKHLTTTTLRSISPSTTANDLIQDDSTSRGSTDITPSEIEDTGMGVDTPVKNASAGLEKMTVWAQRKIRSRLVQKASREYMRAIGSHQRVLAMNFEDLARLLHSSKPLIQATLRFLKYSSQLAQMDMEPAQRTKRVFKNPARVFLSMYMVLAHPSEIQCPSEPTANATGHEDNDAFEALVESSKALLEALQTWMAANLKQQDDLTKESGNFEDATISALDSTVSHGRNATLVQNFDQAWTSYFGFFEAWKNKDARRLLETLLEHARQIEALWRTVQSDTMARVEWQPRIEEQRRDLREKAGQLAGPDGVARLDSVFADFVNNTAAPNPHLRRSVINNTEDESASTESQMTGTEIVAIASPAAADTVVESSSPTTSGVKKRQRNASVSLSDMITTSANDSDSAKTSTSSNRAGPSTSQDSQPKKKPATSKSSAGNTTFATSTNDGSNNSAKAEITFDLPAGFATSEKQSRLQMLHELALEPSLRVEHNSQGSDSELVQRVEAMMRKAYFDNIREDAAKGELGKWIPSILTSIRSQLLDMIPAGSATAHRVSEAFDLEFVQQQVNRKVYDVKAALKDVLDMMSKLCAPVRDPIIRQLQEDLEELSQHNPFQLETDDGSSSSSKKYTATSVAPKDLVSVLQGILELLDQMLMDMVNFKLMAARPKLEQQAIPYEQAAFKTMLADGETSLEATTSWLQASAATVIMRLSPIVATPLDSGSTSPLPSLPSSPSGSGLTDSMPTRNSHRHYEIFANAVLDLLFSKKAVETLDKTEFPETFELDRMRLSRYQNEIQALLLVAVMMNMTFNVAPLIKAGEWSDELKENLFKLMELPETSKAQFADAIIEAKEKALLVKSRSGSSTPLSGSTPSSPVPSDTDLLLTEEKKKLLHSSIARALSFDSTLYTVIAQRVRKVLEGYLVSISPHGGGAMMPDKTALSKSGLGFLEAELEAIAKPIRFMVKYNARVYQQWYDPILSKILTSSSKATTISASTSKDSAVKDSTVASNLATTVSASDPSKDAATDRDRDTTPSA
ncbi:hypothetical protein BGX28_001257 [Mortierella sp. GBA30]|nr:hypothetical protein BGX28_001257 [Mortierella sp. GBA30]